MGAVNMKNRIPAVAAKKELPTKELPKADFDKWSAAVSLLVEREAAYKLAEEKALLAQERVILYAERYGIEMGQKVVARAEEKVPAANGDAKAKE